MFAEDTGMALPDMMPPPPPSHIALPQFDGGAEASLPPSVALPAPPPSAPVPDAAPPPEMPDTPPPDPVVQKARERLANPAPDDTLGPLQVTVEREGDQIRIVLTAERAETLDLMRRHADQLLADLAREGLGHATFAFAASDGASAPPAPDATHIDITARPTASGLDLRL